MIAFIKTLGILQLMFGILGLITVFRFFRNKRPNLQLCPHCNNQSLIVEYSFCMNCTTNNIDKQTPEPLEINAIKKAIQKRNWLKKMLLISLIGLAICSLAIMVVTMK